MSKPKPSKPCALCKKARAMFNRMMRPRKEKKS